MIIFSGKDIREGAAYLSAIGTKQDSRRKLTALSMGLQSRCVMTYSEFITRPTILKGKIEHQAEDVAFKWSICLNTVPELSERVQSSVHNTTEASILRYTQAKAELDRLQGEYDKALADIRLFLYTNLKREEADVLDWKYCSDKSIQQIADIKDLSYSGAASKIYRADFKAAEAFEKNSQFKEYR